MTNVIDIKKSLYSFERTSQSNLHMLNYQEIKNKWMSRIKINNKAMEEYLSYLEIPEHEFWGKLYNKDHVESHMSIFIDMNSYLEWNNTDLEIEDRDLSIFYDFHKPFIVKAIDRISSQVTNISNDLLTSLAIQLDQILIEHTIKALVLEFNILKIKGLLTGNTVDEMLDNYYTLYFKNKDFYQKILEDYPVLSRIIKNTIDNFLTNTVDCLKRIDTDRKELSSTFGELGKLKDVVIGVGDKHIKGKTVCIITFQNRKVVYKPRSLKVDVNYFNFIKWINQKGKLKEIKVLKVIDKGSYGWQEYVEFVPSANRFEIGNFYERHGYMLAIFYILNATDFHYENIIAQGEHPIPVDLETIFQNSLELEYRDTALHKSLYKLNDSVLKTGLIPEYRHLGQEKKQKDEFSAILGGKKKFLEKEYEVLSVTDKDGVLIKKDKVLSVAGKNLPVYEGEEIEPLIILNNTLAGFKKAYYLFTEFKKELLRFDSVLNNFKDNKVRCILRNTEVYSTLLEAGTHTDYLQNGIDREMLFAKLWNFGSMHNSMYSVTPFELKEILEGDVPYFWTYIGSKNIYNRFGDITDFYNKDAFTKAKEIINSLNENDLAFQLNIIEMSLISNIDDINLKGRKENFNNFQREIEGHKIDKSTLSERSWAAINQLVEHLDKTAIENNGDITWIGVGADNDEQLYYAPMSNNLYDGIMGLSLTYSYLFQVTGNPYYKDTAMKTLNHHETFIELCEKNVSAYHGYGAIIYFLTTLYEIYGDKQFLIKAKGIVKKTMLYLEEDKLFDLLGGSAGLILVLLKFYKVTNDKEILEFATRGGDYLVENKTPQKKGFGWTNSLSENPLSGFSHGNTGIAYALDKLFKFVPKSEYRRTALGAIEYEDTLYDAVNKNWIDLRDKNSSCGTFWCHGAPGILLGRALMEEVDQSKLEPALETTLQVEFGNDHSLCHGDAGILDILISLDKHSNLNGLRKIIERKSDEFLKDIFNEGPKSGIPYNIRTPNLMLGDAGIILVLLRMLYPSKIKSLLLLE